MELIPKLRLGWLNGWIPVAAFYVVFALLMRLFPKDVVRRLYDRSGWTEEQRILSTAGLPFALAGLVLIVFTPLKTGRPIFLVGTLLYALSFAGFVIALFNFKNTPPDRPVTKGLYRFSRNPQWVMFAGALLGMGMTVGSGAVLLLFSVRIACNHFRILGEEKACLERYGEAYREYMARVPR